MKMRLARIPQQSKYHAKKMIAEGYVFDSKKEGLRYLELKMLERGKVISSLRVHPSFVIEIHGQRICKYIADFAYVDSEGLLVIEDVKSNPTKTQVYALKKKLMKACYNIEIVEV